VLEKNVLAWFEEKYPEFRQELEQIGREHGNVRTIKYFCDEAAMLGHMRGNMTPYVDSATGEISIHETFLSYVWGLSYAFLVIFDEQIHGPQIAKVPEHGKPLGHFVARAYSVLNYALSLLTDFQPWPEGLPNPEDYEDEDEFYVLRANAIYLAAVDFILCHELAHIACGHLRRLQNAFKQSQHITFHERRKLEQEADQWAFICVQKGIRGERTTTTVGFGAIAGLGSLLFLQPELTSRTHPDKDDRILNVLNGLSLDEKDSLWGIAAAFFLAWKEGFNGDINLPIEFDTYRELVLAIRSQLKSLKRQEEESRMGLD